MTTKKAKYYTVYYRCKANGNGIVYAVSGCKSEKEAIRATHIYMKISDRIGYYAPTASLITKEDFEALPYFNKGREHIRWD